MVQSVVLCCWEDGSWHFEWCRVWCFVAGRMVPGILSGVERGALLLGGWFLAF